MHGLRPGDHLAGAEVSPELAETELRGPLLGIAGFVRAAFRYLRPHWKQMLLVIAATLPAVALETVQPMLLMVLIDAILGQNERLVWLAVLALLGLIPTFVIGRFSSEYLGARVGASVMNDLRLAIFKRLQTLSISEYAGQQRGDLLSRFTSDLDAVERGIVSELPFAITCGLTITVGVGLLFAVEWKLALVLCALLPLVTVGPGWFASRADQASYRRQHDFARVVSVVEENIAAQPVVKAFGLQQVAVEGFQTRLRYLFQSTVRASWLSGLQGTSIHASGSVLLVVAICGGAILAVRGDLSVGGLVAVVDLLWFMVASLEALSDVVPPLQRATGGMQRIQEVLDDHPHIVDAPGAPALSPFSENIVFDRVSFRHDGGPPALADVTTMIRAGESVLVVGHSGAGKSTLVDLLLRLHDPTSGAIIVDGHDLRTVTQASLRAQIGVVFQDSFLFDTTFRDNIRLGKLDATNEEIESAARHAEIHDFIVSLPNGYDARVGPRGGGLSGGQRQRVALARALVRQPAILILDEPASALDTSTEAAINATLQRLRHGRTVISVTHRLTFAAQADRILVLDDGHLAEEGSHRDLLALRGVYYGLWRGQVDQRENRERAMLPVNAASQDGSRSVTVA